MSAALYATIWIAIALFVAGEFGKRRARASGAPARSLWWASALGLSIASVHVMLALAMNNDWNHAVAWRVTEERTRELFGFGWGGAVAGNYAFLAYWAADLWRWRRNPSQLGRQSALVRWGLNLFVVGILAPATIVFAGGPRRFLGVAVMLGLTWAWRPLISSPSAGDHPRDSPRD